MEIYFGDYPLFDFLFVSYTLAILVNIYWYMNDEHKNNNNDGKD